MSGMCILWTERNYSWSHILWHKLWKVTKTFEIKIYSVYKCVTCNQMHFRFKYTYICLCKAVILNPKLIFYSHTYIFDIFYYNNSKIIIRYVIL